MDKQLKLDIAKKARKDARRRGLYTEPDEKIHTGKTDEAWLLYVAEYNAELQAIDAGR